MFQALPSLQQPELELLRSLPPEFISSIAQTSSVTSLKLDFLDFFLDASGLTAPQQLQKLHLRSSLHGASVAVTTFGDTFSHSTLLRELSVGVALHDLALAHVQNIHVYVQLPPARCNHCTAFCKMILN